VKNVRENISVDVVIPVYKPNKKLNLLIDRLQGQTITPAHIFVINTQTEDEYANFQIDKLRTEEKVKVIDIAQDEFDHASTRDMGMKMSEADYVLMMTQDAIPKNRHLIERLIEACKDGIAVTFAKQEPAEDCRLIERYTRTFNYPDEPASAMETAARTNNGIKAIFCSDVCALYNRRLYDEIGGFPAKAIFNEDEVYAAKALKAGYDVMYEPKAVVIHSHNYSGIQYFKRYFDLGVSHQDFKYIFDEYHAEDEGIKLVKNTIDYLIKRESYLDIPVLIYHSGMKFLGMKLGKMYKKLPMEVVLKCTSNQNFWKNK
jgi:rhamnosyltransferase